MAATAPPRVVLIGGSATHFSFSAAAVSRSTGLPAINLGTHAGLGTQYLLDRAKKSLRPGDIAIIAPEYSLFTVKSPTQQLATYMAFYDWSYLFEVDTADWPCLLYGVSPINVFRGRLQALIPWSSPLYRPETVSATGDETAGSEQHVTDWMRATQREYRGFRIMPNAPSSCFARLRARDWTPGATDIEIPDPARPHPAITDFVAWARANRIEVAFAWAPTLRRDFYSTDSGFRKVFTAIEDTFRGLQVPVIGQPERFFFSETEVLDTHYHATAAGRHAMGQALGQALCEVFACRVEQSRAAAR